MAATATFPTIRQVLHSGDNVVSFKAGEALTAGMVVGIAATGVAWTVIGCNNTAEEIPLGVVLYDVGSGGDAAVAINGCIVYVCEGSGATIDAGDLVQSNAADAINGCIAAYTPRAALGSYTEDQSNDTTIDGITYVVGMAVDDFVANGTGRILIKPYVDLWTDHAVV